MKKLIALLMALVMAFSLIACGGQSAAPAAPAAPADVAAPAGDAAPAGELVDIVLQFPVAGDAQLGLPDVEAALNEMTEKDIGVHVTLYPSSLEDAINEATLAVSTGEQLDIVVRLGQPFGEVVSSGLIAPLEEYMEEYAPDIIAQTSEAFLDASRYMGVTYGVANYQCSPYSCRSYMIRNDLAEKYGVVLEEGKIWTLDELEEIFAKVKAGEGDKFYCTAPVNGDPAPLFGAYVPYDTLDGSMNSGVLMLNESFENTTIENIFATDAYKAFAEKMYDWAQKGYISPDASTTTEDPVALVASGNYLGMFFYGGPDGEPTMDATSGVDCTEMYMHEGYVPGDGGNSVMHCVTSSCEHPEKALELLNYFYKNPAATYLIQFGIEGVDYEVLEQTADGTSIAYIENAPYRNDYGLFGNRQTWPVVAPGDVTMMAKCEEYAQNVSKDRVSPGMGYCFDSASVSTEMAAIQAVVEQYTDAINAGASDPATTLPAFIQALEAAGINDVIAENQAQFDAWLAAQ